MKKWLKDVRKDFLRREFIPLKMLYFLMTGGMMALSPFLTIQARSLGMTGEELGMIYGIIPVVGIFAPTLAGLLADKVGNFKIISSLTVLTSGFIALLFLLIPPGRIVHTLPMQLPITINCTMDGAEITVAPPFSCDVNTRSNNNHTLKIQKCLNSCTNDVQQSHLVEVFLNQWSQRTESYEVLNGAEIAIDFDSINETSENYSDLVGLIDTEQVNRGEFSLNNKTLPLKISEQGTILRISQTFCPNFEQLLEYAVGIATPLEECWMTCEAVTETKTICNNTQSTEEINPTLTFIEYLVIRVLYGTTLTMSFTLFEGAVVAIIREKKGDLGLQKVYENFGIILLTPISGYLIDWFSKMNNKEDYRPAFALCFGIRCICAICMLFLNLKFKQPSKRILKNFRELISDFRILSFLCFFIFMGASFGFLSTFLFWLLEDLGADKGLMGITLTVGAACSVPLLMMSSVIIEKLGHVNTLVVCAFVYAVRIAGYSFINNPWMAMLFETLVCFTNALLTVTAIAYVGVLSNHSTIGSLQGIYGASYFGVGRGLGCMTGGILVTIVGTSTAFQIFALSCGISGAIYFLINKFVFSESNAMEKIKKHSIIEEMEVSNEQLDDETLDETLDRTLDETLSTDDNIDKYFGQSLKSDDDLLSCKYNVVGRSYSLY